MRGRSRARTSSQYANAGHQQDDTVDGDRPGGEAVVAHPVRPEREQRQPEQQVQVGPQDPAVDVAGRVQQVVVVVPVDAQVHEAQHVAQEERRERTQRIEVGPVRDPQLEHHDRDDDGDDAVAEGFHASLGHRRSSPGRDSIRVPRRSRSARRAARRTAGMTEQSTKRPVDVGRPGGVASPSLYARFVCGDLPRGMPLALPIVRPVISATSRESLENAQRPRRVGPGAAGPL